jgi:CTP:molybdopterin cytidylyltransferase MocA
VTPRHVVGLVLAAGEGKRLGMPKALVSDISGIAWVARSVATLRSAGVDDVWVVVGAQADAVRARVPEDAQVVEAPDWDEGMGASLRAGLSALLRGSDEVAAVVVMLVDTPGTGSDVIHRLVSHGSPTGLVRATYGGRPGHPVVLGRAHWEGVLDSAQGDQGARNYLAGHEVTAVECGDLSDGVDIDTPDLLEAWRSR